jgi:serine/threonine protein kinase
MSQLIKIPGPGDLLADRYRILGELGRGSYGVVFHARREDDGVEVAIKTLLPQSVLDHEVVNRFTREAQLIARLNHPSIITLYDYGEREGLFYMAMEYVSGRSLAELLEADAPVEPARAGELCAQILRALAHAHAEGIVHRDLKPDNILLQEVSWGEQVKVLDFGIAKMVADDQEFKTLTAAGNVLGTPHYMSPEQISGDDVSHHADLYSVGVILYELLTGSRPFDAPNATAVMVRHLRDDAPPLPGPLEASKWGEAVRASLAKQPFDRIASADAMLEIIERDADHALDDLDVTQAAGASTFGGFQPHGEGDATTQFVASELRAAPLDDSPTANWDTSHLMIGAGASGVITTPQEPAPAPAPAPSAFGAHQGPLELDEPMRMRAQPVIPMNAPDTLSGVKREDSSSTTLLIAGVVVMALVCAVLVALTFGAPSDPTPPTAQAMTTPEADAPARTNDGPQTNQATAKAPEERDAAPADEAAGGGEDVGAGLDPSNAKKVAAKAPDEDPPAQPKNKKPRKRSPKKTAGDPSPKDPPKETAKRNATAKLTVRSEPSGALVLVNGRTQTTKTPLDVEVKKGARVKLELRYKGYKNMRRTISVDQDRTLNFTLKPGVVF